jgi:hypothetical protein
MRFSLDILPARKGDCLMLHYGSKEEPRLMLIDGGPSGVYHPHLKPRILKVRSERKLDTGDPLPVEVVLISHVDDDHIKGILELTSDQLAQPDLRLSVDSLWHNSFDDLLNTKPQELTAGFGAASLGDGTAAFDSGSVLASIGREAMAGRIDVEGEDQFQTVQVLASIPQGRQLRDDASVLDWRPNHKFKGKLILASGKSKPVMLDGDLKVTVVGPLEPELLALQEAHDKWLLEQEKKKKKEKPVEAALAAYLDQSVPNLSSIVLLVEIGGKSIFLTGDARGDKILAGMELIGLLKKGGKRHVDVLKVPHHGSDNNMETDFFARVTADHYVFSGDGEHGNPERETLRMLFEARGDEPFAIHLTYPIETIDEGRKEDWEKEQKKEMAKRDRKATEAEKKKIKVRPDWSPKKNSLAAFFEDHGLAVGQQIVILEGEAAHVIDLLEPLGF